MSAVQKNNYSASHTQQFQTPKDCTDLEKKVHQTTVETIRRVNFKREYRLEYYPKNSGLLSRGIFYPQDIFKSLLKLNNQDQLEDHRKKGDFFYGMAPSRYFSQIKEENPESPSRGKPFTFVLKPSITPSAALDALDPQRQEDSEAEPQLSFLDCGTVRDYSILRGLQTAFGKDKFNALFSADSATPLSLGRDNPSNPLNVLVNYTLVESKEDVKVGQWIYMFNHRFYPLKHLEGESAAQWALCSSTDFEHLFVGFGLKPEGVTLFGLCSNLLDALNAPQIKEKITTEEHYAQRMKTLDPSTSLLLKSGLYNDVQLTKDDFFRGEHAGGAFNGYVQSLNFERVSQLIELPAEEGKELMQKWHLEYVNTRQK